MAGLLAVNVAAHPTAALQSSTWGSKCPTGPPACAANGKYTCKSEGIITLLTCTNILDNNSISIPIGISLKDRDVEARAAKKDGDYCCTSKGFLTASCLNVLNDNVITLPISL
ncbi:hypothetical protein NHQ30_006288 [Ciborinia camelliae]|nr:hypothetical protein NHQ30_006288 [Ciborinia camelliae]